MKFACRYAVESPIRFVTVQQLSCVSSGPAVSLCEPLSVAAQAQTGVPKNFSKLFTLFVVGCCAKKVYKKTYLYISADPAQLMPRQGGAWDTAGWKLLPVNSSNLRNLARLAEEAVACGLLQSMRPG